eukprot:TRINITY_DN1667_c0_g1_i2.p1 TRINITY_DN1667_c0_g1~~TRINITY_DN1667_c0_g1_i2.p1  ORF type:complete len:732 (+),score=350.72 TRINITY_DN1667_c0_g1_i2:176-2371(+)
MSSGRGSRGGYKVLCVSCLHPKASDDVIRESLYREYNKKYGDVSVRVMHEPDERVAYVYFRNFDDARDAKHAKSRIILFDKAAVVEPVYENRRRSPSPPPPPPPPLSHPAAASSSSSSNFYHHNHHAPRYSRSRSPLRHAHHSPSGGAGGGDYHHHNRDGDSYASYDRPPHHHNHQQQQQHVPRRYPYSEAHHRRYTKDNRASGAPPADHHHHHTHHPSHHHGGGGGGGPHHHHAQQQSHHHHNNHHNLPPPPSPLSNKKDKFPNYLNHIPPEDDPLATRTLFTGNLELNITEEEMRRIFGRYGKLVDIDIKRPPPGTGNAYAFIRYENLDQAHRAKLELSGQYIGKFQCKIGYGKVNPTPKVWVGGLGSWASGGLLESEFDRFGAIQKVDYRKGDPHAYIYFESIEAAQAAVQEMRGYPLGGQERRLRMDFADMEDSAAPPAVAGGDRYRGESSSSSSYHANYAAGSNNSGARGGGAGGGNSYPPRRPYDIEEPGRASRVRRRSEEDLRRRYEGPEEEDEGEDDEEPEEGGLEPSGGGTSGIRSLSEITKKTPNVWDGGLILKNSLFPTKLHLIEGSEEVVDSLKDETDKPHLKITQRLRLDQGKLDDVSKRMKTSGAHAIFLGVSDSNELTHENPDIQSRPLRNLVTYLKQKEAAGVISLNHGGGSSAGNNSSSSGSGNKEENGAGGGVLYCFPPCPFSLDLLRNEFSNIDEGGIKEDHLVIVVVCGGN